MKPTRLLAFLAIAVIAAIITAACGVSVGADPTATPAPEPTPTVIPINLITADPATDPEAFKASLTADEASCFDQKLAAQAQLHDQMQGMDSTNAITSQMLGQMDKFLPLTAMDCYSESTAQRVYIGQVSRLAGGLTNSTQNCMVEHTNNSNLTGFFSSDDAAKQDAMQADNVMSLIQSVFCMNSDERAAFETSVAGDNPNFQPGAIDGLECMFNYQDANGHFVLQDAITQFSELAQQDPSLSTDSLPPQARELISSLFDLVPVSVDCGLVTDKDLESSGVTTDQVVCASNALRDPVLSLMDAMAADPNSTPDLGVMSQLLGAISGCGIDLSKIQGLDQMLGSMGGSLGGSLDSTPVAPDLGTATSGQDFSLSDLEKYLSQDQISCLMNSVTPDEIDQMMQTGQPPANMFAIMAQCNITLDQFLQGN